MAASASTASQQKAALNSSRDQNENTNLADEIKNMLEMSEPPSSADFCIFRAPNHLRRLNEQAFTPEVISIGPFHHGNKNLESMEKFKVQYFKRFMQRTKLKVDNLVSNVKDWEGRVRSCYAETIEHSSNDLAKIILVDASFIIEFFLRFSLRDESHDYHRLLNSWLWTIIWSDLILLENQLPFFVIDKLFNLAIVSLPNLHTNSFVLLTFDCFRVANGQKMSPNDIPDHLNIKHFADLRRTFWLPPLQRIPQRSRLSIDNPYSASKLQEAGVEFKVGSSKCLFDLKFKNGVLELPCLKLEDTTESLYRNLMALEQCCYLNEAYVTDYIVFLDHLINTPKDVDLLVQKGIIVNGIGDSNAVTCLINNLNCRIVYHKTNIHYYQLCEDLKAFYEDPRHSWKASLRRDYFGTPLKTASTTAAVILLVLTLIQSVCSILSLLLKG
ncbi:hypothetical protein I3843_06G055300 [Carya illinoinensis]|uniref:Uncharacterized protein n=2 Tax=Carya illinoinensis TaxID=32201 RepID=A0A8T1Q8E4_CARIL|nr:UPF0481 protein At3g47200-like isoform X1 [Carya illinoinensis]KAG6650697.1 hypothetical protein CIPAW_06G060300 [Carya illinoinensis]KAG6721856.1 hypothetical protein I3842_03G132300 [Carya illinoinensis]KAG6721857.1 hypothetical protein I3842_03G132300 [Carya illinoinensis]KAG7974595.1 hypothetical protein I3843_06G055300 [Carya illinoinensis]KAG7974596.1 hypothetical protein I3843_06G055300 [Carya illinoinensis]